MEVILPWPPKELSPNARLHWARRAKAAKYYRELCCLKTKNAGFEVPSEGKIRILVTFCPPDRRHRDADNQVAMIKAGLDGFADALGVNDRRFLPTFRFTDEVAGEVRISLEPRVLTPAFNVV